MTDIFVNFDLFIKVVKCCISKYYIVTTTWTLDLKVIHTQKK